ncbi:NACHT, LRR and PYD domains-containing protein 14 [Holothuria leucospilota]|uniref:NACHT, LRR and PYD domains-containing protein 14 n=1 Tax=Holothuria leucospilota TaxID=206669 RepID=A0A9Q1HLA2_HOLLE|nr:NACHT, LRR and PYD domains-containing protein 14 [Holothuria leucospilota]
MVLKRENLLLYHPRSVATLRFSHYIFILNDSFIDEMANKQLFLRELKARYKQLYDAVQPIPYIRDRLYCVDRVFVEGGIEYLAESWVHLGSYHLVFCEPHGQSNRKFLTGEPGYGKSTLTLQYAYDWCNCVQDSYLKNVEILILLRLRQLGGVTSIYTAIKRFILPSRSQLTEHDVESIVHSSKSVLIVLDGFDEYPDEDEIPKTDIMKIILSQMFQHFEVFLTTRYLPKQYEQYAPKTKRLRLIGFDDRARDEYIRKAVVGNDVVVANRIKQRLQENPILGDLCQVPLFFVMFAHMSHENEDFTTFKTVTSFFQYMIKCFHSHMRNKMEDVNVQRYHMFEKEHTELDKVAFEGLGKRNQQIVWKKHDLIERLGQDFYDQYIRIGILVEEEVIDAIYQSDITSIDQYPREVRFYHKVFCEWYAAHYLSKYAIALNNVKKLKEVLRYMDPLDLQYCYRFACGLDPNAAGAIIECVKQHKGGDKFAVLCILEQGGQVENIIDTVNDLCREQIELNQRGSKLLQRSTVQLLEIASSHNISIAWVYLFNYFSTVDLRDGNHLQLKYNISLPVLTTLSKLTIDEPGREITSKEFAGILKYSSKCLALKELLFDYCLLPPSVQAESVSVLRSRSVKVIWHPRYATDYQLNLQSCFWDHTVDDGGGVMADEEYQSEVRNFREEWGNT